MLEVPILGPHPRPSEWKSQGMWPSDLCLHEPSSLFWWSFKFENHCPTQQQLKVIKSKPCLLWPSPPSPTPCFQAIPSLLWLTWHLKNRSVSRTVEETRKRSGIRKAHRLLRQSLPVLWPHSAFPLCPWVPGSRKTTGRAGASAAPSASPHGCGSPLLAEASAEKGMRGMGWGSGRGMIQMSRLAEDGG